MRKSILALALAGALVAGWALPVDAQQNGIVIQNNGVDSADTAAGADNVRISRAPGNSSSVDAAGANNEIATASGAPRDRGRKDRAADEAAAAPAEEYAAPAEEYAAPVDEGLQTYQEAPAEAAAPAAAQVVALPSTGAGAPGSLPLGAVLSVIASLVATAASLRHRFVQ